MLTVIYLALIRYKINDCTVYPVQVFQQICGKNFKFFLGYSDEEEEFELSVNGVDFRSMPYISSRVV